MRVVFMGTPEFAIPPLDHLTLNHYQVVAVYAQPDKQAGRGLSVVSSPVKKAALAWNLPVMQPDSLRKQEVVEQLVKLYPDVILVAAYGKILPQAVLDIPHYVCINIHPSLLPRYRGASPVAAAILAGDEFTGVSIMLMEQGLDTGPVLARAKIPISAGDTTGSLTDKLSLIAAQLLQDVLVRWFRDELTPQPQSEAEATYAAPLSKKEGEIDWQLKARDIWQRVRGFQPRPRCYTRWQGKPLKIIEAVTPTGNLTNMPVYCRYDKGECPQCYSRFACYTNKFPEFSMEELRQRSSKMVGRVLALNKKETAFGVCTGEGVLCVLTVQLEGKRAVSAAEFLRGQRQFIGEVLPSD